MTLPGQTHRLTTATRTVAMVLSLALVLGAGTARALVPSSNGKQATGASASQATQTPSASDTLDGVPASAVEAGTDPMSGPTTFRSLVPSSWLEAQGNHAYDTLLTTAEQQHRLLSATSPEVRNARETMQKLVPYALKWNDRARNWKWEINVIRSPDINAICLPGGKIILYTGMLERLKLNRDETALLIAHLAAHALREHARARIGQQQMTGLDNGKISPLFGVKGMPPTDIDIGPALIALRYGPDDETEADVIGADIASRAGYDPRAGLVLWEKLERIGRTRHLPFTLAHPISIKRLKDLKKRQKDMLPLYAKAIGSRVDRLKPYRPGR
jgi:Zn-dependent protease with chaperone function